MKMAFDETSCPSLIPPKCNCWGHRGRILASSERTVCWDPDALSPPRPPRVSWAFYPVDMGAPEVFSKAAATAGVPNETPRVLRRNK